MVKIKCTIDPRQVKLGLEALGKDAPIASMRAINRTLASVKTQAVRGVSKDLGLGQRLVRDSLVIHKATPTSLRGALDAEGARIPLIEFIAGVAWKKGTPKGGVTYTMQGKRKTLPDAFITTVYTAGRGARRFEHGGHTGIFTKRGKSIRKSRGAWSMNLPIGQLFGPSVPHVFRREIDKALRQFGTDKCLEYLRHEIGYLLTFGKR